MRLPDNDTIMDRVSKLGESVTNTLTAEAPAIAIPALGLVLVYLMKLCSEEYKVDDELERFFDYVRRIRDEDV